MIYRSYQYGDGKIVDEFLRDRYLTNVQLDVDRLFLAQHEDSGPIAGILVARPSVRVHGFMVASTLGQRRIAEQLVATGIEHFKAVGCREAFFQVQDVNAPMLRFLEDLGATREFEEKQPYHTYLLELNK